MVWIFVSQVVDLSFEICFLMFARDSCVAKFLSFWSDGSFLGEESFDIMYSVETKASRSSDGFDSSLSIPSPKTAC